MPKRNDYPNACKYFESQKSYKIWRVDSIEIVRSEYNPDEQIVMYEYITELSGSFGFNFLKDTRKGMRFMLVSEQYCKELEAKILSSN